MNGSQYRQRVAEHRDRLNDFAMGNLPQGRRVHINKAGHKTRFTPSRSDHERLTIYGRRRYYSVARVMALFEIVREHENLGGGNSPIRVDAAGAYWQAFGGTTDAPACHTCPALLMLDGNLPTLITHNMGLRRHIIVVFADCMMMPALVNRVDRYFDDSLGWPAFESSASRVLNEGAGWQDGLGYYTEAMREIFGDMIAIINGNARFSDPETQQSFEACQAFYEGLFLTALNHAEMTNYIRSVRLEMAIP
ncbi:MAG: hypothetical protein QNJ40_19575 [Xanthomonadales bacterium]|nr:hypothetical protein [Xanthomonadales bacterium]